MYTCLQSLQNDAEGPDVYREDILNPLLPWPEKVYIHGLEDLTTEDIKAFASEHYPSQDVSRVEWIDDTSANIVYPSSAAAMDALQSFSEIALQSVPVTELREAKSLSLNPHAILRVRQANSHDVKKRNAHEQSRFYLMNPEHDPRERRRQYDDRRGRGRDDKRYKRRRSEAENIPFDVNMYDDDEDSLAKRVENQRRPKRARFGASRDDLFAEQMRKPNGPRLRNRSASPMRLSNGDGRYGFNQPDDFPPPAPPVRTRSRANANAGKELLASPAASARSFLREQSPAPRELFPNRTSPTQTSNAGKELFANGSSATYHRRTDAFDAADEIDSEMEGSPERSTKPKSLADRINGGQPINKSSAEEPPSRNLGFRIKGAAQAMNPRVKELFPDKANNNAGKELFGARQTQRRRAEDLF